MNDIYKFLSLIKFDIKEELSLEEADFLTKFLRKLKNPKGIVVLDPLIRMEEGAAFPYESKIDEIVERVREIRRIFKADK